MPSASELGRRAVGDALEAARQAGISEEAFASALLTATIELMHKTRDASDVAEQLRFEAEQLDEGGDFPFMRP